MKTVVAWSIFFAFTWAGLWWTPDQQGQRLFDDGEFETAASTFDDPMRQGIAWYQAGKFDRADKAFARVNSAEAAYNRGNCMMLLGNYRSAIKAYDKALQMRPNWQDASANRNIALLRADRLNEDGGEMGDQRIGADEIQFDKNGKPGGEDTETESPQPLSSDQMQALWLRSVQTKPADFLRAKFAFQLDSQDQQPAASNSSGKRPGGSP